MLCSNQEMDAWQEGAAAYNRGEEFKTNPHSTTSELHTHWSEGWTAAAEWDEGKGQQ